MKIAISMKIGFPYSGPIRGEGGGGGGVWVIFPRGPGGGGAPKFGK